MANATFVRLDDHLLDYTCKPAMVMSLSTKQHTAIPAFVYATSSSSVRFIALALLGSFLQYCIRYAYFVHRLRQPRAGKCPPGLPHPIPIIGNTLSYWWNPSKFTNTTVTTSAGGSPVRVRILGKTIYLVTGRENIAAIWRYSSLSISTILYRFALGQVFGMPDKAANRVVQDDSGFLAVPHPESNVAPHNRVDHYVHESLKTFLRGPGLEPFVRRFENNLMNEVESLNVNEDWVELPDFFDFITELVTPAVVKALCGPFLLKHNPDFCRNFWKYINGLAPIAKGLPRFLYPAPYAIRDSLVRDLQSWHVYARENFDASKVDAQRDIDPYWGCKMMRERQDHFHKMDDFDDFSIAAGDLGAIIGVTSNPIIGSFWACYETFQDAQVLARARFEAAASRLPEDTPTSQQPRSNPFDIFKLIGQPMLQSVFAETLRLRMTFFITRYTKRQEIRLGNWSLPKNKVIFVPTSVAHLDATTWSEGKEGEHPLEEFWAHRFLVYPNDPWSGPRRKDPALIKPAADPVPRTNSQAAESESEKLGEPKFSMEGLYSSWIPFGGGVHICPGRLFSKREMMMVIATMVSHFDVEFLNKDNKVDVNDEDFGIGVQKPVGKVPFRIRRRARV